MSDDPDPDPDEDPIGTAPVPWRYRLGAEIARGGMGRVVEAEDTLLDRRVAIKQALDGDDETRRRFDREVRITARLEHPAIIPVYDAGRDGARSYYVMRRVSGRPLDQVIADAGGDVGPRLTLVPNLLAAVDAVAHAHRRGVVHRDLKPANILLGEHGETLLIDWGLAKVLDEDDPDDPYLGGLHDAAASMATQFGTVIGTPGYMPPEQARGAPVDRRSDVFALGACLYHLLAAVRPYTGSSATAMIEQTIAGPPRGIDELVDGVPRELTTIAGKAMATDPAQRYPDAGALADDLRRFLAGQLVAAHRYTPRERLARFVRRYRAAVAVFAIAAIAMIVVAVILVRGLLDERDRANSERRAADVARRAEADRADQMIVTQARAMVLTDPIGAIAALKQLPPRSAWWPAARGIALGATMQGVAWGYRGHAGATSLQLSPDGTKLLSSGHDGRVALIDLSTHAQRDLLPEADEPSLDAVWIDGGKRVLASRMDGSLYELELDGTVRRVLHTRTGVRLGTSEDGAVVAVVDRGGTSGLYDAATGVIRPVSLDLDSVHEVSVDPRGDWIAFAGPGGVRIADRTGAIVGSLSDDAIGARAHTGPLSIATSDDGELLGLIVETGGASRLTELAMRPRPSIRRTVDLPGSPMFLEYTIHRVPMVVAMPDEVISIAEDGTLVRNRHGGQIMGGARSFQEHVAFANDKRVILIGRDAARALPVPEAGQLRLIAGSAHSRFLAAAGQHLVVVWDLARTVPRTLAVGPATDTVLLDDHTMLVGNQQDAWFWLDVDTGATTPIAVELSVAGQIWSYEDPGGRVLIGSHLQPEEFPIQLVRRGATAAEVIVSRGAGAAVLVGRDRVVLGYDDGRVEVAHPTAGRRRLVQMKGPVTSLAALGDEVAVSSATELVRVDLDTGAAVWAPPPPAPVTTSTSDARGRVIVAVSHELLRWDGDHYTTLATIDRATRTLARTIAGDIVVVSADQVAIIESATGEVRRLLEGDAGFRPVFDGHGAVAAGSTGSAIEVVDLSSRERWAVPSPWRGMIALSPGGARMTQLAGTILKVWDFTAPAGDGLRAWLDTVTNAEPGAATAVRWPWQLP